MQLTAANYHSPEANQAFMSVSQFKDWRPCPARAHAWYVRQDPRAAERVGEGMAVSAYGDALLLDPTAVKPVLAKYAEHLVLTSGALSKKAEEMGRTVAFVQAQFPELRDLLARTTLQPIITFSIAGMPWKARLDILDQANRMIWDVKMVADVDEEEFVPRLRTRGNFIAVYEYALQLAVYQEAVRQATGDEYGVGIIGIGKPVPSAPTPALKVFRWDPAYQGQLYEELQQVAAAVPHIAELRVAPDLRELEHETEGIRCELCEYCRLTRRWHETLYHDPVPRSFRRPELFGSEDVA
jgi:hypothetical protein